MQSEICPSHGLICRTTFAHLHVTTTKLITPLETLMSTTLSISKEQTIVPISECMELLKEAEQRLKRLKTHPVDATLIGLSATQVKDLLVVMARIERKQKDWIEKDIAAEAELEALATQSAMARLLPTALKARLNELSAEELMFAFNAEPDRRIARERFLSQGSDRLTLRDDNEILAQRLNAPLPKSYRSKNMYDLKGRITSTDFQLFSISFVLLDDVLPENLFTSADTGHRTVSVQANDIDDLRLMSLCMTYGIDIVLRLALSVNIAGAGFIYSGTSIKVIDPERVKAAIRKAMLEKDRGLFAD